MKLRNGNAPAATTHFGFARRTPIGRGTARGLAGAAGPVCRVRPAMFPIPTTRRGCRPVSSATRASTTNERAADPQARVGLAPVRPVAGGRRKMTTTKIITTLAMLLAIAVATHAEDAPLLRSLPRSRGRSRTFAPAAGSTSTPSRAPATRLRLSPRATTA
jgi:hypothetical protein